VLSTVRVDDRALLRPFIRACTSNPAMNFIVGWQAW
jgi:hypothetical protein